ncbi:MAG: hypothetical protein WBP81_37830 [Solirubrobacteraceae bacterium]
MTVDARVQRGRTYRHALRQAIEHERFDQIVIAAAAKSSPGFDSDDVAWLLNHAAGELVMLRPSKERSPAASPSGAASSLERISGPSHHGRSRGRRGRPCSEHRREPCER